jgi:hypothetical protein
LIELDRLLGTEGPFELWKAQQPSEDRLRAIALRRVAPAVAARAEHLAHLEAATAIAQKVETEGVLHCFGTATLDGEPVQISEYAHDLDLALLIARGPLPVELATWIARQLADALAHAESLGHGHGRLSPKLVCITREANVRVDFGAAMPKGGGDVQAIAAISTAMLGDQRTPEPLAACLERARTGGFNNVKTFAAALARIFYADLDGDDLKHGQDALRARAADVARELGIEGLDVLDAPTIEEPSRRPKGQFTQMLEQRAKPVEPSPLTPDDVGSGMVSVKTVPTPTFDPPTERIRLAARALMATTDPVVAHALDPSSSGALDRRPAKWQTRWIIAGLVAGLLLVLAFRWIERPTVVPAVIDPPTTHQSLRKGVDGETYRE